MLCFVLPVIFGYLHSSVIAARFVPSGRECSIHKHSSAIVFHRNFNCHWNELLSDTQRRFIQSRASGESGWYCSQRNRRDGDRYTTSWVAEGFEPGLSKVVRNRQCFAWVTLTNNDVLLAARYEAHRQDTPLAEALADFKSELHTSMLMLPQIHKGSKGTHYNFPLIFRVVSVDRFSK